MKRILLIVALLLALLGAILYVGSKMRGIARGGRGTLHSLPENAITLLRINSWADVAQALRRPVGPLSQSVAQGEPLWLQAVSGRIDSTLRHGGWNLSPGHGDSYIACYAEGKEDVAWLVALPVGEGLSVSKWTSTLFEDAISIRQYEYDRTTIAECQFPSNHGRITGYGAVHHGVALWSTSHILLERALRRTPQMPSLLGEDGFRRIYESSDRRKAANLFVRPSGAFPLFALPLRGALRQGMLSIQEWAPWISCDIEDTSAQLSLLGESRISDSLRCIGDQWHRVKPTPVDAIRILPSTTGLFARWGAPSGEQLLHLLNLHESKEKNQKFVELLLAICSGELTLARVLGSANMDPFWIVLMACESTSESLRHLDSYSGIGASRDIRRFKTPKAFREAFGNLFPPNIGSFYAALDGYIAFSSSEPNLRYLLGTSQRQQSLSRSTNWAGIRASVQSRCSFMLYADMHTSARWGKQLLASDMRRHGAIGQLFGNAGQIALQVSGGGNNLFYSMVLQPSSERSALRSAVWEVGLKAPLHGRPQLVKSHRAEANLMLLQDEEGGLYLLDGNGTTLWYRQLGEHMIGEAIAIDALRNGKLQYAFATRSKVWVVDYEGNNLSGFPYTLPSPAAAPLAVFDYAKNHDYRLVVPCDNRMLVLIDAKGKRRADFRPQKMESAPNGPAYLFQHAGKDYIVASDTNRIYILNRKGQERTPMAENVKKHPGSPIIYRSRGEGIFTLLDRDGRLCHISLTDGSVRRSIPLEEWNGYGTVHFAPQAEGDAPYCLVAHSDIVRGYSTTGKSLFRYVAPGELHPWIRTFDFGSRGKLWGVSCASEGKALLLDAKGRVRSEFKANTPFSIGRLAKGGGQLKLVAGDRSSVVVFNADFH